ncbi:alpha/beta-type small acid-soluble spore protein [Bacillus solitudinis]|uniref:alpha/beta-type small acid-soluble spore protein n=1 Tax=Bacillus solitudinis TaxID=2014074 RepID=UPI000C2361E8|nr:alpha/beta-type small acid-soluble spore protein [Bacillus solitudinis]
MTRNKLLVPEAHSAVNQFKGQVMNRKGYQASTPEEVKYEVAKDLDIPLRRGDNGELTSKQAGRVGGQIGGSMVKEMIKIAQNKLSEEK